MDKVPNSPDHRPLSLTAPCTAPTISSRPEPSQSNSSKDKQMRWISYQQQDGMLRDACWRGRNREYIIFSGEVRVLLLFFSLYVTWYGPPHFTHMSLVSTALFQRVTKQLDFWPRTTRFFLSPRSSDPRTVCNKGPCAQQPRRSRSTVPNEEEDIYYFHLLCCEQTLFTDI